MNRTMAYEVHLETIQQLRDEAIDHDTLARALEDYAEDIMRIPTKGAVADQAAVYLAEEARTKAEAVRKMARVKRERAISMEKDGMP